ncbi:hypothetical protein ABXV22_08205 [Vibrio rotiferianus]|uniref:hypothetical protein n=1 Tax=Vibrio rotiferianus TaxID=190895 RepID=UPI003397F781
MARNKLRRIELLLNLEALNHQPTTAPCPHPFIGNPSNRAIDGTPFRMMNHIELVDWTARQYRDNKASLGIHIPPILQRLNISQRNWL